MTMTLMTAHGLESLSQIVAARMLNSIPEGLVIGGATWMLLRVGGRPSSGTRFAAWFVALLAIAGLPLVPNFGVRLNAGFDLSHVATPIALPSWWAPAVFAAWAVMVAIAIFRIAVGVWKLRRLRSSCAPILLDELHPTLRELAIRFCAERHVVIGTSPDVSVPTAVGLFKPAILLPEWALRELSAEELKVILLHEFAHLQRRDDWTNLAQKLLRTLFFFHPAVWWIEKQLCLERELACDDVVLAKTHNPRGYAECLVSLIEKRMQKQEAHDGFGRRSMTLAQAVIGHARQISIRMAQILDGRRSADTRWLRPSFAAVTAFAGLSLLVMPAAPKLVGFTAAGTEVSSSQSARQATPVQFSTASAKTTVFPANFKVGTTNRANRALGSPARKHRSFAANNSTKLASVGKPGIRNNYNLAPMVVPASAKQIPAAPQLLVITQTTEYDANGMVRNSLCVWRVTITGSSQQPLRAELIAKQI